MTVSLSTFTRSPARVVSMLDSGDVILTRRNGPSLLLTELSGQAAREDQNDPLNEQTRTELDALLSVVLRMVTGEQLLAALLSCCPWMSDLPPAAGRSVLAALTDAADRAGLDGVSEVADVLAHWDRRSEMFQPARPT